MSAGRTVLASLSGALAIALAITHPSAAAPFPDALASFLSSVYTPPTCDGAVQHPIRVRIEALDPVRPNTTVRLRLTASSEIDLGAARVRLVSAGSGTVLGPRELQLRAIGPDRSATAEFRVGVGTQRSLVEFKVEGEGAAGLITRGAVYNLLPDGAREASREVTLENGARVLEVAARRIER